MNKKLIYIYFSFCLICLMVGWLFRKDILFYLKTHKRGDVVLSLEELDKKNTNYKVGDIVTLTETIEDNSKKDLLIRIAYYSREVFKIGEFEGQMNGKAKFRTIDMQFDLNLAIDCWGKFKGFPGNMFITDGGERISFGKMKIRCNSYSFQLMEPGIFKITSVWEGKIIYSDINQQGKTFKSNTITITVEPK